MQLPFSDGKLRDTANRGRVHLSASSTISCRYFLRFLGSARLCDMEELEKNCSLTRNECDSVAGKPESDCQCYVKLAVSSFTHFCMGHLRNKASHQGNVPCHILRKQSASARNRPGTMFWQGYVFSIQQTLPRQRYGSFENDAKPLQEKRQKRNKKNILEEGAKQKRTDGRSANEDRPGDEKQNFGCILQLLSSLC